MGNTLVICKNVFKITFKKKSNIFILLFVPVLLMSVIFGLFSGSSSSKTNIGFLNNNQSQITENLYNGLKNSDNFNVIEVNNDNYQDYILKRKVTSVIKIESDFTRKVISGENPKVDLISAQGKESVAWVNAYLDNYLWNLNTIAKASGGNQDTFNKIYDNYKNSTLKFESSKIKDTSKDKQATLTSIGILLMLLLVGGTTSTSIILREKEEQTYYRVKASPVSTREYLAGNFLAGVLIVIARVAILVLSMKYILKVETFIPDAALFIILTIFGVVGIALGLLMVAIAKNSTQAGLLTTFVVTPTCMLSGCFWDISYMPDIMQRIGNFFPQTWTLKSIDYLQHGKSLMDVAPFMLLVFLFAVVFVVIGVYLLRNREDNWKAA
ncbi:MAG: ABC transporter permease [Clostridiaceae bacterium]